MALTEDELTYSIIKKRFPAARPTFEKMPHDQEIGALASATNMALGALRLVQIEATHQDKGLEEHARVARPDPKWVRALPVGVRPECEGHLAHIAQNFQQMLEPETGSSPRGRKVETLFRDVRRLLVGDPELYDGPRENRLHRMMLARLPKEMIDISLMLVRLEALDGVSAETKRAFVLWTLLFADSHHVAWHLAAESSDLCGVELLRKVITKLESWNNNAALPVPSTDYLEGVRSRPCANALLPEDRWFPVDDKISERSIAFLNDLHFGNRRGKDLLLFLQRKYIEDNFPGYDPISGRDEDLPIDLDHIIARKHFHFHWSAKKLPNDLSEEQTQRFGEIRKRLGDQIGNLRWLCASENRKKGAGPCKPLGEPDRTSQEMTELRSLGDKLSDPDGTSDGVKDWTADDLLRFQDIVLCRTARLAAEFIDESGIRNLTAFESKAE